MRKEIKIGHTNEVKYIEDDKFVLEKTENGFNHKINYNELKNFSFVPKLIENTKEKLVWEYVESEMITQWNEQDLKTFAKHIRELHKSDAKFPKNNFRQRINTYLKTIHDKGLRPQAIEDSYREMLKVLANMNNINACHNDLWFENILKDKNNNMFIVDWEYATMGDKHFDLAFFIMSCRLNETQEKTFLDEYNSFDDYEAYNETLLPKYKRFVAYMTLCWAYAQDKMPFDVSGLEKFLLRK